jgi:hypothetical protein
MSNIKLITIAATVATGFWRCGKHFTKDGVTVALTDFTETQWERLKAEPMLHLSDAGEGAALTPVNDSERTDAINGGIRILTAEDFQKDGKPKLEALNTLLGDELGKITGAERDIVWDQLKEGGFTAPEPTPPA